MSDKSQAYCLIFIIAATAAAFFHMWAGVVACCMVVFVGCCVDICNCITKGGSQ